MGTGTAAHGGPSLLFDGADQDAPATGGQETLARSQRYSMASQDLAGSQRKSNQHSAQMDKKGGALTGRG